MQTILAIKSQEFNSGEVVEPGDYLDMDTGALVQIRERDELPEGNRVVRYRRRFRRVEPATAPRTAANTR
ncbi:MAG: hypothetical protein JWL77_5014 [Chthonomonadaceae bacterium]|nr:hypothetical protein [Chthonomonadaceae bacterium]